MTVRFKTEVAKGHSLHLNNFNARDLLEALGLSREKLEGSINSKEALARCERYYKENPQQKGRPAINWSRDPEIKDVTEGVRRIRSLATRSKNGVIVFE